MNELGVLPPNEYKRANGFNYTCGFQAGLNQKWTVVSVNRILKNESYTGTLIQGKRRKINYKVKKSHDVGSENWIRVEDAHDAIISKASSSKYNSCWNWTLVPHHRRQQFIHYQVFCAVQTAGRI